MKILRSILKPLFRNKYLNRWAQKITLRLDNLLYMLINRLVILEQGVHPKHRIINYNAFFVKNVSAGDKVLDIGCGNGVLTKAVASKAGQVVGIDFDRETLEFAKKHNNQENITYILGDATVYPFKDEFDVMVLSNILEHIEDRVAFLKKIKKIAPKILLRVPLLNRDWVAVYKRELGLEYRLDPTHTIEYTTPVLKKELAQAGLKLKNYSIQFGELWGIATPIEDN